MGLLNNIPGPVVQNVKSLIENLNTIEKKKKKIRV